MSLIKKVRIKNFKNLEDVEVEIKPLTFLFGPNGSGKSSFMKAMMFLSKNLFPLNTGKTVYKISDEVDLGSYQEIVTNNNVKENIVFEIYIKGDYEFPKIDFLTEEFQDPYFNELLNIRTENFFKIFSEIFSNDEETPEESEIKSLFEHSNFEFRIRIEFTNDKYHYNLMGICYEDLLNNSKYEFTIYNDSNGKRNARELFTFLGNNDISNLFNKFLGYEKVSNYSFTLGDMKDTDFYIYKPRFTVYDLPSLSEVVKKEFIYFRPLRIPVQSKDWNKLSEAERTKFYYEVLKFCYLSQILVPFYSSLLFRQRHASTTRISPQAKYFLDRNEFLEDDYYGILSLLNEKRYGNKNDLIFRYLKLFEFGKAIKLKKGKETGSLMIRDSSNKWRNASNESSGFIQLFPILFYCSNINKVNFEQEKDNFYFYNPNEQRVDYFTLLVEQPELHLHPRLQSRLADLFVDTIRGSDNIIFIETHSEHLIRKIQVLTAQEKIGKGKVSIVYFDNSKQKAKVQQMSINENGLFEEDWPVGFFDNSINLTMEMMDALKGRKN